MNWLRGKIKRWLGISDLEVHITYLNKSIKDLVNIGVDVHFTEPHMILIFSKLNGGQLRHISANFKDLKDLNQFVKTLKYKYNTEKETWDIPPSMKHFRY